MIILDSNVLSELMRPKPEARVIAWLDSQSPTSIWTTSVTVFEIRFGLQVMPAGKRRTIYTQGFERLLDGIDHRIAPFDTEAAQQASALMALRKIRGRPRELRDTMIAGIVVSRHATLATRNTSHFDDVSATMVDPWTVSI
jgi:predicted nucleic acid-binding protein